MSYLRSKLNGKILNVQTLLLLDLINTYRDNSTGKDIYANTLPKLSFSYSINEALEHE